jgi:hypothetical protein
VDYARDLVDLVDCAGGVAYNCKFLKSCEFACSVKKIYVLNSISMTLFHPQAAACIFLSRGIPESKRLPSTEWISISNVTQIFEIGFFTLTFNF